MSGDGVDPDEMTSSHPLDDRAVEAFIAGSTADIDALAPLATFAESAARLQDSGRLVVEGAMTHLACADEDDAATRRQLDRFDEAIVCSIIDLACHLLVPVVAEGIEDLDVGERLRLAGCAFGQGYGYSRPLPPDQFSDWLATITATKSL